jgi:hypothetical protein
MSLPLDPIPCAESRAWHAVQEALGRRPSSGQPTEDGELASSRPRGSLSLCRDMRRIVHTAHTSGPGRCVAAVSPYKNSHHLSGLAKALSVLAIGHQRQVHVRRAPNHLTLLCLSSGR